MHMHRQGHKSSKSSWINNEHFNIMRVFQPLITTIPRPISYQSPCGQNSTGILFFFFFFKFRPFFLYFLIYALALSKWEFRSFF